MDDSTRRWHKAHDTATALEAVLAEIARRLSPRDVVRLHAMPSEQYGLAVRAMLEAEWDAAE